MLNIFKSRLFPIKHLDKIPTCEKTPTIKSDIATEPAPKLATEATLTKHKKSKLKLQQEYMKEIIADKKYINDEMF